MPNAGLLEVLPSDPTQVRAQFSRDQIMELKDYAREERDDAESSRFGHEVIWRECLRMYNGTPERPIREIPIPNAPNIEIPLGAIASDAIYAQTIDTIFQISPVVTVRAVNSSDVKTAKALQRFINWGIENEWQLREAISHASLDSTQLGTGVYYIPYIEQYKKTLTLTKISNSCPRMRAIPLEDVLVPGSASPTIHDPRWVGYNQRMIPAELEMRAKLQKWDIRGVQTTGDTSMLRERREAFAQDRESGEASRDLVEVMDMYMYYDIDHDGIAEDLLVTIDTTSDHVLRAVYNPFDRCRPFESFVYQPKPHFFYGMGVIEMIRELERAVTDVGNYWLLNMILANSRVWVRKEGTSQEGQDVWPGMTIMTPDPSGDIQALQMADVYQSAPQALSILVQFAERRTGVADIAQGRGQAVGSRTPGITALSALQNVNQRFAPAFDNIRLATAAAVRQCLYRYQERLLMGDRIAENKLMRLLGPEDGALVVQTLSDPDFDNSYAVELTASNASVNREADRQSMLQVSQFLGQYYSNLMSILQVALNPQVPQEMRNAALKIVDASAEVVDKMIRTFDVVREPEQFIIRTQDLLGQQIPEQFPPEAVGALGGLMQQMGAGGLVPNGILQGQAPPESQPPPA